MFFGFVREYKGLDVLIKANQYLKDRLDDYCIIVCGECYGVSCTTCAKGDLH